MEKFPDIPHPPCQPLPPGVNCAASKGVVVGVDRSALFCFRCGGGKGGGKDMCLRGESICYDRISGYHRIK